MKTKLAIAATTLIAAFAAGAYDITWKSDVASGSWSEGSNWDGGIAPGESDTAVFNSEAEVLFSQDVAVGGIVFNKNVTFKSSDNQNLWPSVSSTTWSGTGTNTMICVGFYTPSAEDATISSPIRIPSNKKTNGDEQDVWFHTNGKDISFSGGISGDGLLRFTRKSGGGINSVNISGDNSGFTGTVEHYCNVVTVRFKDANAGFASADYKTVNLDSKSYGGRIQSEFTGSGEDVAGVLAFGSLTTSHYRDDASFIRFNNNSQNVDYKNRTIVEVGSGKLTAKAGDGVTNNKANFVTLRKVGSGELEVWQFQHIYGTEINGGTLTVTHADALSGSKAGSAAPAYDSGKPNAISFGGGTLKYGTLAAGTSVNGTAIESDAPVTTDWSALVRNSTEFISVDTDGKDITWASAAIHSSNADAKGFEKKGEGTLALTGLDGNVTFPLFTQSSKTNYIHGGTLEIINERNGNTRDFQAKMLGTGTLRLIDSSSDNSGFRLRPNDAFSEFGGTVEWAKTKHLNDKAYGFMLNNGNLDMSNIRFRVTGSPEEPRTVMKGETGTGNTVTVGAFDHLSPNAQLAMTGNWNLNILGTKGDSYMNGVFSNKTVTITKTGDGRLTIGPSFSAPDGSKVNVNAGVLALEANTSAAALSSYLTIASGVTFAGEGVFGDVNLSVNDVIPPALTAETDKATEFTLLTATSFTGTSKAMTTLLDEVNASVTGGKWKLRRDDNGDGTFTLKCRFVKDAFIIVVR